MLAELVKYYREKYSMQKLLQNGFAYKIRAEAKSAEKLLHDVIAWNMRVSKLKLNKLTLYWSDDPLRGWTVLFELNQPVELEAGKVYDFGDVSFKFLDAAVCSEIQIRSSVVAKPQLKEVYIMPYGENAAVEFEPYTLADMLASAKATYRILSVADIEQLKAEFESILHKNYGKLSIEPMPQVRFELVADRTAEFKYGKSAAAVHYRVYTSGEYDVATVQIVPSYEGCDFQLTAKAGFFYPDEGKIVAERIEPLDEYVVVAAKANSSLTKSALVDEQQLLTLAERVVSEKLDPCVLISQDHACKLSYTEFSRLLRDIDAATEPVIFGLKSTLG